MVRGSLPRHLGFVLPQAPVTGGVHLMPGWMGPESRCGWCGWRGPLVGVGETALALLRVPSHGSSPGTMQKHAVVPPWRLSLGRGPPHAASACSLSRGQMCQASRSGNPQYLIVTAEETTSPPHPTGVIMKHGNVNKVRKWESQAQLLPPLAHRTVSLPWAGVSSSLH